MRSHKSTSKSNPLPSKKKNIRRRDKRAKVSSKYSADLVRKIFTAPQKGWRKIAEKNGVPLKTGKDWRANKKVEDIAIIRRDQDDRDLLKAIRQQQQILQKTALKQGLSKTVQMRDVKQQFEQTTKRKAPAEKIIYGIMRQHADTEPDGRIRRAKKMFPNKEATSTQMASLSRCPWHGG